MIAQSAQINLRILETNIVLKNCDLLVDSIDGIFLEKNSKHDPAKLIINLTISEGTLINFFKFLKKDLIHFVNIDNVIE